MIRPAGPPLYCALLRARRPGVGICGLVDRGVTLVHA
jgi:hypothetical protein